MDTLKIQSTSYSICNWCQVKGKNLPTCVHCVSVYYCSQVCQEKDWETHKLTCKKTILNTNQQKVQELFQKVLLEGLKICYIRDKITVASQTAESNKCVLCLHLLAQSEDTKKITETEMKETLFHFFKRFDLTQLKILSPQKLVSESYTLSGELREKKSCTVPDYVKPNILQISAGSAFVYFNVSLFPLENVSSFFMELRITKCLFRSEKECHTDFEKSCIFVKKEKICD